MCVDSLLKTMVDEGAWKFADHCGAEGVAAWAGTTHPQKSGSLIQSEKVVLVQVCKLGAIFRRINF